MTPLTYAEQLSVDAAYSGLADSCVIQMTGGERADVVRMLDAPTWQFKQLALALQADGCTFPKQQAALMLRNTPAVAAKLLRD